MQYGSIGWSVGATLGYAQAVPDKRVIACIGDGSFQVSIFTCEAKNLEIGSYLEVLNIIVNDHFS